MDAGARGKGQHVVFVVGFEVPLVIVGDVGIVVEERLLGGGRTHHRDRRQQRKRALAAPSQTGQDGCPEHCGRLYQKGRKDSKSFMSILRASKPVLLFRCFCNGSESYLSTSDYLCTVVQFRNQPQDDVAHLRGW